MAARNKTSYKGVFYLEELRLNSRKKKEKVYYIRYRAGGRDAKLIEEKAGRESEGMTAAKANQERALRARGVVPSNREKREAVEAARRAEEGRPTFDKLWSLYDETNASRSSRKADTARYVHHLAKPFGHKTPDELVTFDLDRLRITKLKTLSPQTVKHLLALLRRIIIFGARHSLCPMPNPSRLHFIFPRVDNQRTESLSDEQMLAYLAALDAEPDQNAAAFIRLALSTGMRKGALMALRWDDVDFEQGFIILRGASAKNERTESIPMSHAARAILERIERVDSPYVFPGRGGKQRTDFKRIAQRVRDKAGLSKEEFRPLHGLRHTFASRLASSGQIDLYALQKLLTHNSPQMTQRYAHLTDERLQRAAAVAGDIFKSVAGEENRATVLPYPQRTTV